MISLWLPRDTHTSLMRKKQNTNLWDFPGGPLGDSTLPMQGAWVRYLVGELDLARLTQLNSLHATAKNLHAATKKPAYHD